jgi:cytochrome P450
MLTDPDLVPFEPPPRPLPLVSGLWKFRHNFIETFPRSAYEEPVTRLKGPLSDWLLLCDPDLIAELLVARADGFGQHTMTRRGLGPVIGDTSLLLAEGAEWRWQRRTVAPTFRHETLLAFVPVFSAIAAQYVARWRNARSDAPIDVEADMNRIALDVIVETMLGGAAALNVAAYRDAVTTVLETVQWHGLLMMFRLPPWTPFPGRRRARRASQYLHREMHRVLGARRARQSPHPDLLDLLLTARDPETGRAMSDDELTSNLLTFINAGHETTAVALTWTLWLVARDPVLQRQLFEEVVAVAGDAPIDAAHVERLTLCRQALQEGMRLYPPVPAMSRQAHAETHLAGHRITPTTMVIVPIFVLHRNARLWDNPNTFSLERFAPDQAKARPRHAYLPFGAGPRICIGATFAMLEATVVLATFVRAFRLRPLPGHKPKPIARVSLRPQGGMPLLIEAR